MAAKQIEEKDLQETCDGRHVRNERVALLICERSLMGENLNKWTIDRMP